MSEHPEARKPRPRTTPGRYRPPKRQGRPIWLLAVALGALAVVLVVALARRSAGPGQATPAVTAAVLAATTAVPQSAWDAAGTTGITAPTPIPAASRPTGAPTLLYMGAEYCPYCAAERWVLVAALSRFGSFSGLQLTTSSSTDIYPNTATFAFNQATFKSADITVQTVEMQDRARQPLQTPTAAQNALLTQFDTAPYATSQGSIPFLLIGGRYVWSGSQYSPGLLSGLTWSQIATPLSAGATSLTKTILANGNEISAAICAVDGGKPAQVCGSAGVTAAAGLLPKGA